MGTYYDYSVAMNGFIANLVTKLQANGWTLAEGGYTTVYPTGYPSIFVQLLMEYYLNMWITNDSNSATNKFTYVKVRMRSTYDGVNHRPTTTANGGAGIYRICYNYDYSTSGTALLLVKAWIWDKGFILRLRPDPNTCPLSTNLEQIIVCAEGQAVDAPANTMLLLAPTYANSSNARDGANPEGEVGQLAFSYPYGYCDVMNETHFIHCLGDGTALHPAMIGFDVSSLSNKLRTMNLLVWRTLASGSDRQSQIMYQITQIRGTYWQEAVAVENDTFVVGAVTYKLVSVSGIPGGHDSYGRPMFFKTSQYRSFIGAYYYGGADSWPNGAISYYAVSLWIQSA